MQPQKIWPEILKFFSSESETMLAGGRAVVQGPGTEASAVKSKSHGQTKSNTVL